MVAAVRRQVAPAMVTTRGPTKRPSEPVTRRAFRHPGTGHEVTLVVEREVATPGDGEEPGWRVDLEEAPGAPAWLAALRYIMCGTRAQAQRDFGKRQRVLRAAGYRRVE
jgi:hypothetical protein